MMMKVREEDAVEAEAAAAEAAVEVVAEAVEVAEDSGI